MNKDEFEMRDLIERGYNREIFPLQTIQSMAERWGKSRQTVNGWRDRYSDFPKPVEGIIAKTAKTPTVYPMNEVKRFGKVRGLEK